jgi:hypothetical protein
MCIKESCMPTDGESRTQTEKKKGKRRGRRKTKGLRERNLLVKRKSGRNIREN